MWPSTSMRTKHTTLARRSDKQDWNEDQKAQEAPYVSMFAPPIEAVPQIPRWGTSSSSCSPALSDTACGLPHNTHGHSCLHLEWNDKDCKGLLAVLLQFGLAGQQLQPFPCLIKQCMWPAELHTISRLLLACASCSGKSLFCSFSGTCSAAASCHCFQTSHAACHTTQSHPACGCLRCEHLSMVAPLSSLLALSDFS